MDHSKFLYSCRVLTILLIFNELCATYYEYYITHLFLSIGIFSVFSHNCRHTNSIFGEQTGKTIPYFIDVVYMLSLLHIDRSNWRLLDEFKTCILLVDINTLSYKHIHVVFRNTAYRMDTPFRNISYEVSVTTFFFSSLTSL